MTNAGILIVDDDRTVRQDLLARLSSFGYKNIFLAEDEISAITVLKKNDIDLILLDILLADNKSGIEVAKLILKKFSTAIVFITGTDDEDLLINAKNVKSYGILFKPFNSVQLKINIQIVLVKYFSDRKIEELQKNLVASEKRFRQIFENSSGGIAIVDPENQQIVDVNNAFCKILGFEKDELLQLKVNDITPAEDYEIERKLIRNTIQDSNPYNLEKRYIRKDKKIIFAELGASLLPDFYSTGKTYALGVIQDITKSKELKNEILLSEKRLKSIFQSLPDLFFVLSEDGTYLDFYIPEEYIDVNRKESLLGNNISFLGIPDIYFNEIKEKLKITITEKIPQKIEYPLELNGEPKYWEGRLIPFKDNEAIAIIRDITDIKNARENLQYFLELNQLINKISTDFILLQSNEIDKGIEGVLGLVCEFINWDRGYIFLLNESKAVLTHEYCKKNTLPHKIIFTEFDITNFKDFFNLLRSDQEIIKFRYDVEDDKNMIAIMDKLDIKCFINLPMIVGNQFLGYIGFDSSDINKNITEENIKIYKLISQLISNVIVRKNYEIKIKENEKKLSELNASKDKFFSIIAHDLKSPFQGILGFTELLMEDYDILEDKDIKSLIKSVRSSVKNTYELIENLLNWSRMQTDKMQFNPIKLNLSKTVDDVINLLLVNFEKKKIKIFNDIKEDLIIPADEKMMKSVLQNLISNAIKFSNKGSFITLSSKIINEYVEVSIIDNGVGIPPEDAEKLFRLDSNFSTKGTENELGTGLGLILCKEMIERHSGTIKVYSEVGKGSKFIFSIPITKQVST